MEALKSWLLIGRANLISINGLSFTFWSQAFWLSRRDRKLLIHGIPPEFSGNGEIPLKWWNSVEMVKFSWNCVSKCPHFGQWIDSGGRAVDWCWVQELTHVVMVFRCCSAIHPISMQSFQSTCNPFLTCNRDVIQISNWLWQASQDCEQILQLLMDFLIRDGLQKRSQDCMNADWSAPTWCESSTIWRIVSESEGDGAIGTGICRMVMDCVENSWIASKLQDCALGTVRWNDCDCIMWSHCNFAVHWICMDWLQALAPTGALYDIASMPLQIKQQPTILQQWTRVAPGLQDRAF